MTMDLRKFVAPGCLAAFALGGTAAESLPEAPPRRDTNCLPLTGIRLAGVHALSRADIDAIWPAAAGCIEREPFNRFLRDLSALYLRRGLVAARVEPQPVARDGTLTIRVDEGRVARLQANVPGSELEALFPGMVGRPFDLRALEQGLDQANRLATRRMDARVTAARDGGVDVELEDHGSGSAWHGRVGLDNGGTPATGTMQAMVSLNVDNPGGVYDMAGITLEQTLDHLPSHRRRGVGFYYTRPHGYWTLNLGAGWSDYFNSQRLVYHTLALSGQTTSVSAQLERVVQRDATHIDAVYLQLVHQRLRHYIMDELRELASPTLTVLGAGIAHRHFLPRASLNVRFGIERGMPWLGATKRQLAADDAPSARFDKWVLRTEARLRLSARYELVNRSAWQTSRQRLPAAEELELASPAAVRGFERNALAGETGWYTQTTLQGHHATSWGALRPRVGVDAGRVLWHGADPPWRGISGASIGLGLLRGAASVDLEYSRPLRRAAGFVAEGHRLIAGVAWYY